MSYSSCGTGSSLSFKSCPDYYILLNVSYAIMDAFRLPFRPKSPPTPTNPTITMYDKDGVFVAKFTAEGGLIVSRESKHVTFVDKLDV